MIAPNRHSATRLRFAFTCAVVLTGLAIPQSTAQDSNKTRITNIRLGFDGTYKVGCWTQLEVTLQGGSEKATGLVSVTMPDSDGVPVTYVSPPERMVAILPGTATKARLMVRPGQSSAGVKVSLISVEGRSLATRKFESGYESSPGVIRHGLASTNRLVVALGKPVGLGALVRTQNNEFENTATRLVRVDGLASLPLDWQGYEGVSAVVLSSADPSVYRALRANSPRVMALKRWVELGGSLVLFCGSEAEELLGPDGPLEAFAPGEFVGMVPLRDSAKIQRLASVEDSINRGRIDLRIPQFDIVTGEILASAGNSSTDLPLAVRTRVGLGEITFIGLDPDQAPLADWSGRTELLRTALDWPVVETDKQQDANAYNYSGTPDLINQLSNALGAKFEGVTPVPFGIVALLVLIYIGLIGPGDYFFVKRVLKRMELTWITFPLIVVLVSLGAYWLAYYLKGDQLRVNQVEIVDVDMSTGNARGTVWTNFFSPRAKSYQLSLQPRFGGQDVATTAGSSNPKSSNSVPLTAWLGMPGTGLGGMQGGVGQTTMFDRGYAISPQLNMMNGLPVQEWSTKTITARWTGQLDDAIDARLNVDDDGIVSGRIENTSGINFTDCLLLHSNWAYRLKPIGNGASAKIDSAIQPRSIKTMLTNAAAGEDTVYNVTADGSVPYVQWNEDVVRTLKVMMFYEAAGGSAYAPTVNRYQHFIELSHLLDGQQAILLARAKDDEGSQWMDGDNAETAQPLASDQDRRWIYYRFVIPLKKLEVLGP
ncbi:hypothetical protein [Adhaeretor mobilis]|uniref:Uncharacterized protein n=1 Tax=Adhaeretor mobilis TaxID=1930276 RepID=A0A517N0U5_9BACT|nr:hypothetical protein [Adhaeretor mobilis]QDT00762.1 hypothetical protein HG15A2_41030 [Adhaeretor mobilis]